MLLFFLRFRGRSRSCSRYLQWIRIGDTDHFCETAVILLVTHEGFVDEFTAKMDIDPLAGLDAFFVVLSDTGDREGYGISLFCNYHKGIGGE